MEIALNRLITADARALARCGELAGGTLALHIRELDLELVMRPQRAGIEVVDALDGVEPDVRLSGRLRGFADTLFAGDGGSLTGGSLRIEGDVGLAQGFAKLLQGIDFDFEDWLGERLGDVPAHFAGQALRGALRFARRATDTLSLDTAEYLREESRDLVGRNEFDAFAAQVDALRADAKRLAARLRRLQQRTGVSS